MSQTAKKRFWENAEVVAGDGGFGIALDGRALKTPAKAAFSVPTMALANAVAAEWQAQEEKIDPASMPMTRRANAAIDKVSVQKGEVAEMLSAYGASDLLCYRADYPAELAARQAQAWDPLLAWAEREFSSPLAVTAGIIPKNQPADSLANLRAQVFAMPVFILTGFHDLVSISGSLIIGLAVLRKHKPVDQLWTSSRVDEIWQEEQWGSDEQVTAESDFKRQEFLDAREFCLLSEQREKM